MLFRSILRAVPGEKENLKAEELFYGPLLLRNGNPVLRRFLVRQHGQLTQILQTLEAQKESEQIIRRIAEVQEKLQQNESAYTILGAIKSAGI